MAYCDSTKDRRAMEKECENSVKRTSRDGSVPPKFEFRLNKDGLRVYKEFVFLPGPNSDNPQHLKLHLPTGHIYNDKNDHCTIFRCPGVFNCLGHNAHPIHSRIEMNLEAFHWQVRLFLLEEGGRVKPKKAIEICYQDWPLELGKTPAQLYESWKKSLNNFHKAGKEENGQPTFMKKNFIEEYPQKKLDRLMDALRLDTHYWTPYSSKKSAVSGRDQPKQMANKLPVMSVSLSDSSLDNKIPTSSPNPRNSFKNGRPWGPLSRRCSLPEERIIDEPVKKIKKEKKGFAEALIKRSVMIYRQDGTDVFAVPLSKKSIETSSIFQRFVFDKVEGPKEHRTILVLGEDESERRKFIDEILNFIFNVEKEDKFRFRLIHEEDSTRTNCINVYDIHHCEGFLIPFSMTIVDTPSFDSFPQELEMLKVKEIIEIFHEFFENEESVEELDMICNLGDEICPSFLSVFANDLEENIHCLRPSNYGSKDDIQQFFTLLSTMKKKSLSLTKQVLDKRKRIESMVNEIRSLITTGLSITDEMVTAKSLLSNCQNYVQQTMEDLHPEVKRECRMQKMELPAGQLAKNCLICNVTCSSSVFMDVNGTTGYYWPLINLSVSTDSGFCTVCPEKCNWNVHSIKPYRLECVQQKTDDVVSNKRNSEVESKWQDLYKSLLDMVNLLQEKISVNCQSILERFQSIERCIMSLDKISCGKLLIRKLISFYFFDTESQLNQLGLEEEFKSFKKWFN